MHQECNHLSTNNQLNRFTKSGASAIQQWIVKIHSTMQGRIPGGGVLNPLSYTSRGSAPFILFSRRLSLLSNWKLLDPLLATDPEETLKLHTNVAAALRTKLQAIDVVNCLNMWAAHKQKDLSIAICYCCDSPISVALTSWMERTTISLSRTSIICLNRAGGMDLRWNKIVLKV